MVLKRKIKQYTHEKHHEKFFIYLLLFNTFFYIIERVFKIDVYHDYNAESAI